MPTIASEDKEFVFICEFMRLHVGEGGDDLSFRRELGALLEFEVANGARQGEVSVDATEIDETAGSSNTVLLG